MAYVVSTLNSEDELTLKGFGDDFKAAKKYAAQLVINYAQEHEGLFGDVDLNPKFEPTIEGVWDNETNAEISGDAKHHGFDSVYVRIHLV